MHTVHGSRSAWIDPRIKRSKAKVTRLSMRAWACMSIGLLMFSSYLTSLHPMYTSSDIPARSSKDRATWTRPRAMTDGVTAGALVCSNLTSMDNVTGSSCHREAAATSADDAGGQRLLLLLTVTLYGVICGAGAVGNTVFGSQEFVSPQWPVLRETWNVTIRETGAHTRTQRISRQHGGGGGDYAQLRHALNGHQHLHRQPCRVRLLLPRRRAAAHRHRATPGQTITTLIDSSIELSQYLLDRFSRFFHQMEDICVSFLHLVQFFRFLNGRCHGNQFCGKIVAKLTTPCTYRSVIPKRNGVSLPQWVH